MVLRAAIQNSPAVRPTRRLDGDSPAGIIYTSGTTGTSKGAVLSHSNFALNALNLLTCWQITSSDRFLLTLPLFHVHGLGNGLHCWLMSWCRTKLLSAFRTSPLARHSCNSGQRCSSACPRCTCECWNGSRRTPVESAHSCGSLFLVQRLCLRRYWMDSRPSSTTGCWSAMA
jgi:acyl-CoA synthetase (AMP-forming)/AMP-acid ligase II